MYPSCSKYVGKIICVPFLPYINDSAEADPGPQKGHTASFIAYLAVLKKKNFVIFQYSIEHCFTDSMCRRMLGLDPGQVVTSALTIRRSLVPYPLLFYAAAITF